MVFIISHAVSLGFELGFATYFSIWRGRGFECTFHSVSQIHFFYFLSSIISKKCYDDVFGVLLGPVS